MKCWMAILLALLFVVSASAQSVEVEGKAVRYKGFVELGVGAAYNLNTAQTVSVVNMQTLWTVQSSHGVAYKGWFGGLGMGYHHSQRDKEDMNLNCGDVRYCFEKCKVQPAIGLKGGFIWDPFWIEKVQLYGALSASLRVYDRIRVGMEGAVFSRPSRHFTANGVFVISFGF